MAQSNLVSAQKDPIQQVAEQSSPKLSQEGPVLPPPEAFFFLPLAST